MSISSPSRKKRILSTAGACLASAGLALAVTALVYALRGIWPFGTDNVAYMDAAQFYVPGFYRLWDCLHGLVSADVDWFSGLAEAGGYGWGSFLYPANWVFLLVARDQVLEGLSLYLAVELALIALVAAFAVSVRFPRLGVFWRTLLALTYAFCGFTLQYYSNFSWLDAVGAFPLLLLGLDRLLREGKPGLYTAMYALYLCRSVYYTYMVSLYVLLYALGYCYLVLPGDLRAGRLTRLGLGTALAFGVGAPFWLGGVNAILNTSRFQEHLGTGLLAWNAAGTRWAVAALLALGLGALALGLARRREKAARLVRPGLFAMGALGAGLLFWRAVSAAGSDSGLGAGMDVWDLPNTRHTFLMLLGLSLCFALLLRTASVRRACPPEERNAYGRARRFFLYLAGVFVLPMVFTNIDTVWHFGQYNFFPMRYGFMLPATVIGFAGAALEQDAAEGAPPVGRPGLTAVLCGAAVAVLALKLPVVIGAFKEYGACFLNSIGQAGYFRYFAALCLCAAAALALYWLLLRTRRRAALLAVAALFLAQTAANAYGLIAPNDDHTYTHEYDPAYIAASEQLYDAFSGQTLSPLSRTKNVDGSLSAGYPAIAGVSALSSIRSGNSAQRLGMYEDLGYTVNYYRIMDVGGTVFTDMLLGVDRVLSVNALDEDLYIPDTAVAGVQVGRSRYPGVTCLMYDPDALADYGGCASLTERINALYRAFTDGQSDLAFDPGAALTVRGEGMRTYTLSFDLDRPAFVYMRVNGMAMNITAGGRTVTVPTYLDPGNTVYPAAFNANVLSLGLFPAGTGEVSFTSPMDLTAADVALTCLDKQGLDSFSADANRDPGAELETYPNGLAVTLTADRAGRSLFLPLGGWWYCTVNGVAVNCQSFLGTMASVPLQPGENRVVLYRGAPPAGSGATDRSGPFFSGVRTLALLSLVLLAVWVALEASGTAPWREKRLPRWLSVPVQAVFLTAAAAVVGFVYVAPIVSLLAGGTVVWF